MAYIVVVEDNEDVSEVICDALRGEGHRCFVIRSRRSAERFLSRIKPDLVVIDCLLIGGYGLEVAKQLTEETKVPVIVTTGDEGRAVEAEQFGFRCLRKPFRLAELVAAVSLLLGGDC